MISNILIFVSACIISSQSEIIIVPKSVFVVHGDNVTLVCRVSYPIEYCKFSFPNAEVRISGPANHELQKGICRYDLEYENNGNNSSAKCILPDSLGLKEIFAIIPLGRRLISKPDLKTELKKYVEGDQMDAVCSTTHVEYGNMSFKWYLNDKILRHDGVGKREIVEGNIVKNFAQNLTREDHLGVLKCEISLVDEEVEQTAETHVVLNVSFAPKFGKIIDEIEIESGTSVKINLLVRANPRPSYELLGNETMFNKHCYQLEMQAMGKEVYEFTLFVLSVTQDIEYKLNVFNEIGAETSEIRLCVRKTSPRILTISGYVFLLILCILTLVAVGTILKKICKKLRNTQSNRTSRNIDAGHSSIELNCSNKIIEHEVSWKNSVMKQCSIDAIISNSTHNEYVEPKHVISPLNTERNAKTEISNEVENENIYEELPLSYNGDDNTYDVPKKFV